MVSHFLRPLATNSRISKLLGWSWKPLPFSARSTCPPPRKPFAGTIRLQDGNESSVCAPFCLRMYADQNARKKRVPKGDTYLQTRIEEWEYNDFVRDQASYCAEITKGNQVEVKRGWQRSLSLLGHCHCWKVIEKFRNYRAPSFPLRIFSRYILIRMAFLGDVKMFQCLCSIQNQPFHFFGWSLQHSFFRQKTKTFDRFDSCRALNRWTHEIAVLGAWWFRVVCFWYFVFSPGLGYVV